MTPAQRFFPEILAIVANVCEISVDDMTAEDRWAQENVREARRVAYIIAADAVQMTYRQIAVAMQRNHKAIYHAVAKIRRDMARNALLRRVVTETTRRVKDAVQDFRLFGAEAAE